MKAIDSYICVCFLFVFFALCETIYVVFGHKDVSEDDVTTVYISRRTSKVQENIDKLCCCPPGLESRLDRFSRYIFPGMFVFFVIIYIIVIAVDKDDLNIKDDRECKYRAKTFII